MAIMRAHRNSNYICMSNIHLNDKTLSAKAKGILSWALSCSDNWQFSVKGMMALFSDGERSIESGLEELKEHGYLAVTKLYPDVTDSRQIEYVYDFFEKPQVNQGVHFVPLDENQGVHFQGVQNVPLANNIDKQISINKGTPTSTEAKTASVEDSPTPKRQKKFQKPTPEEVSAYAAEKGLSVDAERFCDFYESKGWLVGKSPMKDWRAAVRNWGRDKPRQQPQHGPKTSNQREGESFEGWVSREYGGQRMRDGRILRPDGTIVDADGNTAA